MPNLTELNLLNFSQLNEVALKRLLNGCTHTLRTFRLHYGCVGISTSSMLALAKCINLKDLQLGDVTENYSQKVMANNERLQLVRKMLGSKKFNLE
jgi:hypothetical protein